MTTLVSPSLARMSDVSRQKDVVATLNPATMETLQLFRGDTIIVRYVESCRFEDPYLQLAQRKEEARHCPHRSQFR